MDLVWPHAQYLAGYVHALQQGWSPDNLRSQATLDELARIADDPQRFVLEQSTERPKALRSPYRDGGTVARLPRYSMWMWDGEFCGSIGFRWQPGTTELPPYGWDTSATQWFPGKRRRGYATRALRLLLPHARAEGLARIELTTDADNVASRRVIEANGGILVERFYKPREYGGAESLRFRMALAEAARR